MIQFKTFRTTLFRFLFQMKMEIPNIRSNEGNAINGVCSKFATNPEQKILSNFYTKNVFKNTVCIEIYKPVSSRM